MRLPSVSRWRLLVAPLIVTVAFVAAGCGGSTSGSEAGANGQDSSSQNESGAGDSARAEERFKDAKRDTKSADLDILSGALVVSDDVLRLRLKTAKPVKRNVIYSAMLHCGSKQVQLGIKRAGGATDAFVLDVSTGQNTYVSGEIKGRSVTVSAPREIVGCPSGGLVRFEVIAEGTNGRAPHTDRVPKEGRLGLEL